MLLNLTDLSDEPLQTQIWRQIRANILTGELTAGLMLPSIRQLARDQRVSVITVQRGYEALEREGLIHSRRGKGFFVVEVHDHDKKLLAEQKLFDNLEPVIKIAKDEGMSEEEIRSIVEKALGNKG